LVYAVRFRSEAKDRNAEDGTSERFGYTTVEENKKNLTDGITGAARLS